MDNPVRKASWARNSAKNNPKNNSINNPIYNQRAKEKRHEDRVKAQAANQTLVGVPCYDEQEAQRIVTDALNQSHLTRMFNNPAVASYVFMYSKLLVEGAVDEAEFTTALQNESESALSTDGKTNVALIRMADGQKGRKGQLQKEFGWQVEELPGCRSRRVTNVQLIEKCFHQTLNRDNHTSLNLHLKEGVSPHVQDDGCMYSVGIIYHTRGLLGADGMLRLRSKNHRDYVNKLKAQVSPSCIPSSIVLSRSEVV